MGMHLTILSKVSEEKRFYFHSRRFLNLPPQEPLPSQNTEHMTALPRFQLYVQSFFLVRDLTHKDHPIFSKALFTIKGHPHSLTNSGGMSVIVGLPLGPRHPRPLGSIDGFTGYMIEFKTLTPHHFLFSNQPKTAQGKSDLQNALNHLLSQRVFVPVPLEDKSKILY